MQIDFIEILYMHRGTPFSKYYIGDRVRLIAREIRICGCQLQCLGLDPSTHTTSPKVKHFALRV